MHEPKLSYGVRFSVEAENRVNADCDKACNRHWQLRVADSEVESGVGPMDQLSGGLGLLTRP